MLRYFPGARVKSFALITILCALQFIAVNVSAQTDPAPQGLPYSSTSSFSTLLGGSTTYPAGLLGGTVPGPMTTTVLTAAFSSSVACTAGQTNASVSPFVGDLAQKIGILSSSSTVNALCLALNTTSVTSGNVQLIYTAATQGQTLGGYIDELDLQYRIGTTGTFTTVPGATYSNNALTNTNTAVTTEYNPATVYVTLPAACTNKAIVELRWIPRNVSGSGIVHPGFSISNITAQASTTTDYYSLSAGNLDNIATWGTNTNGTGSNPPDFVSDGQVFHISNGNPGLLGAIWAVSGAGSKIIVDGTDFKISTNRVTATIDVNAGRTLTLQNNTLPTLGNLDPLSTVVFSNLVNVNVPIVTPAYGNIAFSNGTVALPGAIEKLTFAGNFSLLGTATFNGANASLGYSLVSYGNNPQVINGNGKTLTIWNMDVGSSFAKTGGGLSLASNTNIVAMNSVIMSLSGSTPLFSDGGDTITVYNNFDCGGAASAYNFTGTVSLNTCCSGSCNIRGGGSSSSPCVASVNNLIINNTNQIKVDPSTGGVTFAVKGNLIVAAAAASPFNFQNNNVSVGGNFIYNSTNNGLFVMGNGTLVFNGAGVQTYTSSVTGGNILANMTMNNTGAGLTLNAPLNVTGITTLTNGVVSTGTYSLNIGASGSVTGANAASYVSGNLSKTMPAAGVSSMFYEVGDNSYSPVMLTFNGGSVNSGSINVKSTAGTHPAMATSYVNTANFVDRYWTVTNSAVSPAPTSVNVSLSYNDGDITSGLGSNSGYIIREYMGGGWSTVLPTVNTTTATAPLLPLASIATSVNPTSFSGDYVAGAPDCSATPGTASASPAALCGPGTATVSLTGATSNTGNTYQWQSSPDGSSWTPITGATNATYTTSVIATTTYYRSTVGCIPIGSPVNSAGGIVTVNPLPAGISGATIGCIGQNTTMSDASGVGRWSSSNTGIATIGSASGVYSGIAFGTTTITYTIPATGCYTVATVSVNPTPTVPVASPLLVSLCPTATLAQLVSASHDTLTGSVSISHSGPLNKPILANTATTDTINISSIPPGAVITNVSVTFADSNSSGSEYRDWIYDLEAPNGQVINLINGTGGSSTTQYFRNISVGSAGVVPQTAPLVSGNLYMANESTSSLISGIAAGTSSWSGLYSVPDGNWVFIADNDYATGEGILQAWTINISYIIPPSVTWSNTIGGTTGLYTNSLATANYTAGTSTGSVYMKPTVTTTYNVTAAIGSCSSFSPVVAVISTPLYIPVISGASAVCVGSGITMTDSVSGGTWSCANATATIGSASGIAIGVSPGTAVITYQYSSGGCTGNPVFKTITVNATPVVSAIAGNPNICYSGSPVVSSLSDATSGGLWSSGNTAVATVDGSLGTVTGILPGSSVITYSYNNGFCTTNVNTTVNVYSIPTAVTASPPSLSFCAGTTPQLLTASGGNIPGSTTVSSGPVSVACFTVTPGTTSLTVSGVPAGATVTGIAATFNASCSYDGDAQLNLKAPNGSVINLFSATSGNSGVNFVNTTISSAGSAPIPNSGAGAPWTGTYAASNGSVVANFTASAYSVTTTSWAPLEASNPNGTWTLAGMDNYKDSTFTITSWSVTVSYVYQSPITWAPLTGLYTNTSGTAYSGASTNTIYTSPPATTVYTISATNGTCASSTNLTVSINAAPSPISGPGTVCQGSSVVLSDPTTGGTWTSSNPIVAGVGTDGTVTGASAGTSTISYSFSGSCEVNTTITVNPITPVLGSSLVCIGGSSFSLSDVTSGGTWSNSNAAVAAVGSTGIITIGSTAGTSAISYIMPSGCNAVKILTVNPIPPAPFFSPSFVSVCPTGPAQLVAAYGDSVTGPVIDSTGPIAMPLFTVTPTTSNISVSGIPAGAVITAVRATINGHGTGAGNSKEFNYAFNLMAPNGNTISLTNSQGSSSISDFRYITFGSDGSTTIPSGAAPGGLFTTGLDYIANLGNGIPASITAGYRSNVTSWSSLYSAPNGTWTLIGAATFSSATGLDTLKGWSLSIYYYVPPTAVTWAPTSGLYTDAGAGTAYTGTSAGSLYAEPGATTVYTVTSTLGTCSNSSHFTASVNTSLYVPLISGLSNVCVGSVITLTDSVSGGVWSSTSSNVIVGASTGTVTGVTGATTAVVTYTYTSGLCQGTTTKTVSVNALPTVGAIGGNTNICLSGFSTVSSLSDVTTGGTWSSGNTTVATIGTSGNVTAVLPGSAVITYTYTGGCTNNVTTTLNVLYAPSAISVSPSSSSLCASGPTDMLVASGTQPGTFIATTGTMSKTVNASHDVEDTSLTVSLPPNAIITDVAVTLNFSSLFLSDYQFNLQAPNGKIINLINKKGPSNVFSYFTNTTVSSVGTLTLSASSAPFTNSFEADTTSGAIPVSGFTANTDIWDTLFTVPSGTWTLIAYNTTTFTTNNATLLGYTIRVDYTTPVAATWASVSGLYTNSGAGTAYTAGTQTDTVYALPAAGVVTYTASATNGFCASNNTATVTVNPLPAILGNLSVCVNLTTALSSNIGGGTWASSGAITTDGSGNVTAGVTSGTGAVTYTTPGGCSAIAIVTVNPNPGSINGTLSVCQGQTTQLSDAGGGSWVSGSISNATISGSGLVNGLVGGTTSSITYTLSTGCSTSAVVTVNALPGAITGTLTVCQGAATQLTDAGGGTWLSGNVGNATVSGTGLVNGVTGGTTATVTYTSLAGCSTTAIVTVNASPAAISGMLTVCQGLVTQLTDAVGGTWTSSNPGNGSVSGSGLVNGLVGNTTTTITFTDLNSCKTTAVVTVNPLPGNITGTLTVCQGLTTQLTDAGGGTWWNGASPNATVDGSGVVSGVNGGTTAAITYTLPTGCITKATVTVNPLPSAISGSGTVCLGAIITLSDAGSGAWSSGFSNVSIDGSGNVTGVGSGSATVTYTLGTGCYATKSIFVNPTPTAILGTDNVCVNATTSLSDAGEGAWTSSNPTNATVDLISGLVAGLVPGTTIITYTLPVTGCYTVQAVTVNALPSSILGTATVSVGYTTSLSDAGGGTWSASGDVSVGSTGLVTGLATGTGLVTYSLPTGCATTIIITVNATPPAITGVMNVCVSSSTTLSDAGAGTWASGSSNVSVGLSTGVVSGLSAGTALITFTFDAGGSVFATVTVNGLPDVITGPTVVCQDATITLSDDVTGGNWSSTENVSVSGTTGVVTGVNVGTAKVTYTLFTTGCYVTANVTVNPLPLSITGVAQVCVGSTTTLSDLTPGGTWSSSTTADGTVGTSGVVAGIAMGETTITYTAGGCYQTDAVVVNPLPNPISGTANVCAGVTTSLSDAGEGTWSSSNSNATIGSISGMVGGVTAGTATITYMLSTGCVVTTVVTVNAVVVPSVSISAAPGDTVCSGTSVLFTAAPTNGGATPAYQWSLNSAAITGATNSTYSYAPGNGDVISAIITSNAICAVPATAADAVTMTVITTDTSSVHISVAPGDTVCQGSFALFAAAVENGGTAPVYLWSVNGTQVGTGATYGYIPSLNDNVYCQLVSNQQCVATDTVASNHIVMRVDTSYVPIVEILATPGNAVGPLQADTFRAVVSNGGPVISYQWFVNTTLMSGATNEIFVASDFSNNDSVTCVVVSARPCGYASFNSVKITVLYEGLQQVALGSSNVRLMPNPNKGLFTIKGTLAAKSDEDVSVEITDMLGQVVYSNIIKAFSGNIDVPVSLNGDLANGTYLVNIRSANENIVLHFVIGR